LRSGDLLLAMDKQPLGSPAGVLWQSARGLRDSVVLLVRNRSGERVITVKLAARPEE